MKATLTTGRLHAAVRATSMAVMTNPSVPVLGGVRMTLTGDGLELVTFDLDTSARITIPPTSGDDSADPVVVSHRLLDKCLSVATAKDCTLELGNGVMLLTAGRASWRLPLMAVDKYPNLPTEPAKVGTVDAGEFSAAINAVSPAASRLDELPSLTGLWLTADGSTLTTVATDRYRLHSADLHLEGAKADGLDVLVPAARMIQIARLIDGTVTLRGSRKAGLFAIDTGALAITTRLLDDQNNGKWIDWRMFGRMVKDAPLRATVVREELAAAIKQCVAVSAEDRPILSLDVAGDTLSISLAEQQGSAAEAALDAKLEGQGIQVRVNGTYLIEALAGLDTTDVQLHFTGPVNQVAVGIPDEDPRRVMMVVRHDTSRWLEA